MLSRTSSQIQAVLELPDLEAQELALLELLLLGLSLDEVAGLHVEDVAADCLLLRAERYLVPLGKQARQALRPLLLSAVAPDEPLFRDQQRDRLSGSQLETLLCEVARRAEVPGLSELLTSRGKAGVRVSLRSVEDLLGISISLE